VKKSFIVISSLFFLSGVSNPLIGALPSPFCSVVTDPELDKPTVVFDGSLNSFDTGFSQNVWAAEVSTTVATDSGNSALLVNFNGDWGGIEFNSSHPLSYQKIGSLRLVVQGLTSRVDRNLRVYLLTENGKKLGLDVDLEKYLVGGLTPNYQVAEIPIDDLFRPLNQSISIGGMGIQSEFKDSILVDDIEFVAKEPVGLVTLFDDHLHAKLDYWLSDINAVKGGVSTNGKAISVETQYGWGGFATHSNRPINEKDFGAITLAVKSNTDNLNLYIYAVNEKGERISLVSHLNKFLYGETISSGWKIAWVPIQELIPTPQPGPFVFHGIGIESEGIGTFWIDDVKIREEFKLPLPGGKSWRLTSEVGDKGCYGSIPPLASHTTVNYHSLDFVGTSAVNGQEFNVPVYASASGTIVHAGPDSAWPGNGTHVIINHDNKRRGEGLETKYLHLREGSLAVEKESHIRQGQYLGILGKSGSGLGYGNWDEHIHIGFYYENSASENKSILQSLHLEGMKLSEYVATCSGGRSDRYFPSSNTRQ